MNVRSMPWRKIILGSVLLVSVGAALWLASQEDDEPEVPRPSRTRRAQVATKAVSAPPQLQLQSLQRPRQAVGSHDDAFAPHSWVPLVAPAAPPPPPAPAAPILPFTYHGQLADGPVITVFLMRGEQTYVVKRGDTLLDTYRVDDVQPSALVLTYLPLNQQQVLPTGEMN